MIRVRTKKVIFAVFLMGPLLSCGGSSSDIAPNTVPAFASTGYAKPGDRILLGDTFILNDVPRIVGTTDGQIAFVEQDIQITIPSNTETVRITIDGQTFDVPSINGQLYRIDDGDTLLRFYPKRFAVYQSVYNSSELTLIQGNNLSTADIGFGYNISAQDLTAISGTAEYEASLGLTAYDGSNFGEAGGAGTLSVNFDSGEITGDFTVRDLNRFTAGGREFVNNEIVSIVGFDGGVIEMQLGTYRLVNVTFSGNRISGALEFDGTGGIQSLEMDGTFFGSDAQVVAATVTGEMPQTNFGTTALVSGQLKGWQPAE